MFKWIVANDLSQLQFFIPKNMQIMTEIGDGGDVAARLEYIGGMYYVRGVI